MSSSAEARFRAIFQRIHAGHPNCLADEWLMESCADPTGHPVDRPVVWSRRNGPWLQSDILWIGAAPGNAGGMGGGPMGAHGTRIPFGGDIAGANLAALMGSIGLDRNQTFIAASYNQLPARGGGEPTSAELNAPVGAYPSSIHIVRDTILAACPRLIVALGNVALRTVAGSVRITEATRIPSLARLQSIGLTRNQWTLWPEHLPLDDEFMAEWRAQGTADWPALLWLTHPSAQNMSPFARTDTLFYQRLVEARAALAEANRALGLREPPAIRPHDPLHGIYALPEWRKLIAPRHRQLDALWRSKGI